MNEEPVPEQLTIETDALAIRRKRARSGLAGLVAFGLMLLPLVIMMVGGGIFGMDKPAAWPAILASSWIGGMAMTGVAGTLRAAEMARKGAIEISAGRLSLVVGTRREELGEGAVVGGSVTPRIGGALLTLSLVDGRTVSAFVPSEAAGARALASLHIDPMGRALVGRFQSGLVRSAAGFGAAFALILLGGWLKQATNLSFASGLLWAALCLAFLTTWFVGTRQPEIAVGADGVRIRGKLGARFIALDQIVSAKVDDLNTLSLTLRDGTVDRTRVALGNGPMVAAVAHRIELAQRAAGASGGAPLEAALARGARTIRGWRDELRARAKNADYRHAALEGGDLDRLVGASGASAEHRLGAAIALREVGGDDARARIRLAAEQCVDGRVRIALQAIADEGEAEEQAVEQALSAATTTTATATR